MEYLDAEKQYPCDIALKVVIVGKSSTGKSFFCSRIGLNYSQFQKYLRYDPTIGIDSLKKTIKFLNKIYELLIWDTCGQKFYQSLIKSFYKNTNIFLIFYDSFDRDSFKIAQSYFKDIKAELNKGLNPIYILVRSKYENALEAKEKKDIVSDEEVLEYADENNIHFFHIAINEKYETGINELLEFILKEYIKKN